MVSITREDVGALNAQIKINVPVSEYEPLLDKSLKLARKNVDLKGFRKGMVPVGLVKKMYGNQILVEELNKLLNQEINNYISENKIDLLGTPIPVESEDPGINIQNLKDYEFIYEFGTAPEVQLRALSSETQITKYQIKVSKDDLANETERLRKQTGEVTNPEGDIQDDDVLLGAMAELEDSGVMEGGVQTEATFPVDMLTDAGKKSLLGFKIGDHADIDVFESFNKSKEEIVKHVLNQQETAENMGNHFRFTLTKINRIGLAKVDTEFFDKIFGKDQVKNEEEFNKKLEEEISNAYNKEMDNKLNNDVLQFFIENTQIDLPDEFLKRWIQLTNEKSITQEQVELEYESFQRNLKWTLIAKKIKANHNLEISDDEIVDYMKTMIKAQFGFGGENENDDQLTEWANKMLENAEQKGKTYDQLLADKIFNVIKDTVTIQTKEVTLEEFKELN